MRCLAVLPLSLVFLLAVHVSAEDWTTLDGKQYRNVTVTDIEDDAVTINYAGGSAKIPYYNLPLSVQKEFGQDPDSLEARKKAADEAASAGKALAQQAKKIQAEQQQQQALEAAKAKAVTNAKMAIDLGAPLQNSPTSPLPAVVLDTTTYPGAFYSYNQTLDTCYLDSAGIIALPFPPPAAPSPDARVTLTFRVATVGTEPQAPDRIVATILSVSPERKFATVNNASFNIDGNAIPLGEDQKKGSEFVSSYGQVIEYVSFYLTPAQVHTIVGGNVVKFSVGSNNYIIDSPGIAQYRRYLGIIDKLPPPSSFIARKFHQFIHNLPPISTIITQICIYIVLGSFVVIVFLAGSACFVGATRFLKM